MGLFIVTDHIGEVAYCLYLDGRFIRVYPVFHMSLLYRFVASGNRIKPPQPIKVKAT